MPLPLTVSCFSKIQIGFTFLVLAHPDSPRQRAVKWMCVFRILCRAVPKIENGWLTVQSVYLYRRAVLLGPTQCHQRRSDQLAKTPAWLASMSVEHLSLSLHPPNSQSTPSNISWSCHFYANMRLPHISHVAAFFAYFSKVCISHIFSA